jgi:hypothetical protein
MVLKRKAQPKRMAKAKTRPARKPTGGPRGTASPNPAASRALAEVIEGLTEKVESLEELMRAHYGQAAAKEGA